jgi:hypothetical protein
MGDVLKIEHAERLEDKVKLTAHMITYGPRNADATRRALSLKPRSDIHRVAMQIGPIRNRVAKIDPYAKADSSIRGLVAVVDRDLFLDLNGTAHRPVYAVEYDQQRIATSLHDFAAMLADCRIDQIPAQRRSRSRVPVSSSPIKRLYPSYRNGLRQSAFADLAAFPQCPMPCQSVPFLLLADDTRWSRTLLSDHRRGAGPVAAGVSWTTRINRRGQMPPVVGAEQLAGLIEQG